MRLIIILIIILSSCTPTKVPNISHPSKRDIKKSMKHSDWKYASPKYKIYKR